MKKFLENLISTKEQRVSALKEQVEKSTDVNEVRNITSEVESLTSEIAEARAQLAKINETPDEPITDVTDRSAVPPDAKLVGSFNQNNGREQKGDVLDSIEYREAFANYVKTGKWEFRDATAGMVTTGDIGKVIPNTIMNELIKELKDYGRLYSKVRKINVQGGVEFPIEELVPTVSWITETTPSSNQAVPEIKTSIVFGYHVAEARIAQSLLSSIVSLPVLESEIAKLLAEAFVKEFDRIIINGTGSGQPLGVLNDTRVPAAHKITMTDAELKDWTSWRTKLFAKIKLAYRGKGIIIMTPETWETYVMTLKDDNHRPLYAETYNPVNGQAECRFCGREVLLVEPDILKNFSEAANDEAFAIYMDTNAYCINSNLQIGYKRYFDEATNKWINKGLTIMDGKLLDVNGCFIIKKSTATSSTESDDGGNG